MIRVSNVLFRLRINAKLNKHSSLYSNSFSQSYIPVQDDIFQFVNSSRKQSQNLVEVTSFHFDSKITKLEINESLKKLNETPFEFQKLFVAASLLSQCRKYRISFTSYKKILKEIELILLKKDNNNVNWNVISNLCFGLTTINVCDEREHIIEAIITKIYKMKDLKITSKQMSMTINGLQELTGKTTTERKLIASLASVLSAQKLNLNFHSSEISVILAGFRFMKQDFPEKYQLLSILIDIFQKYPNQIQSYRFDLKSIAYCCNSLQLLSNNSNNVNNIKEYKEIELKLLYFLINIFDKSINSNINNNSNEIFNSKQLSMICSGLQHLNSTTDVGQKLIELILTLLQRESSKNMILTPFETCISLYGLQSMTGKTNEEEIFLLELLKHLNRLNLNTNSNDIMINNYEKLSNYHLAIAINGLRNLETSINLHYFELIIHYFKISKENYFNSKEFGMICHGLQSLSMHHPLKILYLTEIIEKIDKNMILDSSSIPYILYGLNHIATNTHVEIFYLKLLIDLFTNSNNNNCLIDFQHLPEVCAVIVKFLRNNPKKDIFNPLLLSISNYIGTKSQYNYETFNENQLKYIELQFTFIENDFYNESSINQFIVKVQSLL